MPISTSGAIAAVDSAAIDHQSIPCDPVWLATMTGSVLASVLVNKAAKKYSFQQSTTERMNAATIPGNAIVIWIMRDQFNAIPLELEQVTHDPDDDRQHHQRIDHD